jgi:hypothetical protein
MKYTAVLSDSFKIWWKYKSIWVSGILLLALWGAAIYTLSHMYIILEDTPLGRALLNGLGATNRGQIVDWRRETIIEWAAYFVLYLLTILAVTLPRAALIGMVRQAETENSASLRQGWQVAKARFWSLFGVLVLLGLRVVLIILFAMVFEMGTQPRLSQPAFSSGFGLSAPLANLLICGALIISPLAYVTLSLTEVLAARVCVLERLGARKSIRRGWQLLRRNLSYMLLNSLVIAVLFGIFSFGGAAPVSTILMLDFATPGASSWLHNNPNVPTKLLWIGSLLFFFIFSVVLVGILYSLSETVWTRLYGEFVRREAGAVQVVGVQAGGQE